MKLDIQAAALFLAATTVLLGSPGPGVAALIGVGRQNGFLGGQRFFWGLQIGLALAAGVSAAGIFSVISTIAFARFALDVIATAYLIWLAFKIATSAVGEGLGVRSGRPSTAAGGLLLGISNPKSYLAFASLFGAYPKIFAVQAADLGFKFLAVVFVTVVVDLAWLWIGVCARKVILSQRAGRLVNVAMALIIVSTALIGIF